MMIDKTRCGAQGVKKFLGVLVRYYSSSSKLQAPRDDYGMERGFQRHRYNSSQDCQCLLVE